MTKSNRPPNLINAKTIGRKALAKFTRNLADGKIKDSVESITRSNDKRVTKANSKKPRDRTENKEKSKRTYFRDFKSQKLATVVASNIYVRSEDNNSKNADSVNSLDRDSCKNDENRDLRYYRKKAGLTLPELAKSVGVKRTTIFGWETKWNDRGCDQFGATREAGSCPRYSARTA